MRTWAENNGEAARAVGDIDRRRREYINQLLVQAGVAPTLAETRAQLLYWTLPRRGIESGQAEWPSTRSDGRRAQAVRTRGASWKASLVRGNVIHILKIIGKAARALMRGGPLHARGICPQRFEGARSTAAVTPISPMSAGIRGVRCLGRPIPEYMRAGSLRLSLTEFGDAPRKKIA
jgi:hypothetical protein